jgi:hypothetical protein
MYKITLSFTAILIRGSGKIERLTETITNDELDATLATIAAITEIRRRYPDHAITAMTTAASLDFDGGKDEALDRNIQP